MNAEPDRPEEDAEEAEERAAEPEAESSDAGEADPLADLQATADEHWNKYIRAAAELENVRKRAERDVEKAHKYALERFAGDLLAVCDSLDMALATEGEVSAETLKEGSEATLKLLMSTLLRYGIEVVDPLGEPFDPELHEAMTMQPSADAEPGSVLTVFQKGYSLNGRLLRPARVVVAAESVEEG
jgi:molecular chaperone GrpE